MFSYEFRGTFDRLMFYRLLCLLLVNSSLNCLGNKNINVFGELHTMYSLLGTLMYDNEFESSVYDLSRGTALAQ